MNELLPCPFCGGEAETQRTYDIDTAEVDGYFVACRNKNCTAWPETDEYLTEAEAVAAWNTRAERTCHYKEHDALVLLSCDVCGHGSLYRPNYCPSCGAKVVGE